MSHGRGCQGGCPQWDGCTYPAALLSEHLSLYRGAQDPLAVLKDDVPRCCHEAELQERDVSSGSKIKQAQPQEQTNGARKRSVVMQHSPQKGMRERMSSSESAAEL